MAATTEIPPLVDTIVAFNIAEVVDWKGLNKEALLGMQEEQVVNLGYHLGATNSAYRFAIGDWLNFVEKRFSERYSQMEHITGLSFSTLRSYASVAASISRVRRRTPEVSWSHHEAIASLPPREQRAWLERIFREGWTVEQTREARREHDDEPDDADSTEERERKLTVKEASRQVWISSSKHGDIYHVPGETMLLLGRALGEPV